MRIVVDAMGSDNNPVPDVAGSVMAARKMGYTIILTGNKALIERELDKHDISGLNLEIVHATDVITMDDKPVEAGKTKPNSSMHVGMNLVKDGLADAFVTAGNTGAAHVIAMLYTLERIRGVKRPVLTTIYPINGQPVIFLDVGANADCKPEWLVQFSIMGDVYAKKALSLANPRIGLLSIGEEDTKGSSIVQSANALLKETSVNYIGLVEPKDVMQNKVDVLVTDGFTGNILIKTFEASIQYMVDIMRKELKSDILSSMGGLLAKPGFKRVNQQVNPNQIGGAPLLGIKGVVIICHGGADAYAIQNGILQASRAVDGKVVEYIEHGLSK